MLIVEAKIERNFMENKGLANLSGSPQNVVAHFASQHNMENIPQITTLTSA